MTFLHNKGILKSRRKELRNNSTSQEIRLWCELKNKKLGVKFRRQQSIGYYIVDFCCFKLKLIIEIDGKIHKNQQEYDKTRTAYLVEHDFTELRFTNTEIDNDIQNVLARIQEYL